MGAHGVGPEPDPPVGVEVLHESERTRVTRLFLPGGTVIRKQPLGAGAPRRLRHELGMLGRLRGVLGVAQLLDAPEYRTRSCWRTWGASAWRECPRR